MPTLLRVVGYAIVSADGMIADTEGAMPPAIINPADQRFFAQSLDEADVVVHGRHSQEQDSLAPRRQRLMVTRRVTSLAPHPNNPKAQLWNPEGATLEEACGALGVSQGVAAIIGGTHVFGLFLPRYDEFHLSRAERARLPGGRPVFPGIPPRTPDDLLQSHGLRAGPVHVLDADAAVSVVTWRR